MAEYIEREALIKAIKVHEMAENDRTETGYNWALDDIEEIVRQMPSADVQSVRRGRWIAENSDNRGYADCYTCTNCNHYSYTYTFMRSCEYEYCPNCGARMDGDKE